jgi:hypothetical protein
MLHLAQGHTRNKRPDPEGFESQSVRPHLPLQFAHGGCASFTHLSPLMTSFNTSVYGGSRDLSNYEGPRFYPSSSGGVSVMSSMAGSVLPTSLDSSESFPPAMVINPVAPAIPSATSVLVLAAQPTATTVKVEQAPPQTIKDRPFNLGIKSILDKETWTNVKKVINAHLLCPPYWPGLSKQLITTAENAAASSWWEEVVTFFCKLPVSDMFVKMPKFDGKGFEMLAYIDSHFNPSGAVDSLSHIFDLINIKQNDDEPVVSLKACFSRVFLSLKMGGISIDSAVQVGFMLCALLSCYQAVVQEFCLGRHLLTAANLQTVIEQCINYDKGPQAGPVGKDCKVPKSPSANTAGTNVGEGKNAYKALVGKPFKYHFGHWKKALAENKSKCMFHHDTAWSLTTRLMIVPFSKSLE